MLYTDPDTGLQVRWEGVEYPQFKTVEWTLYFKNTGRPDTPILADIQALDTHFQRRRRAASLCCTTTVATLCAGTASNR